MTNNDEFNGLFGWIYWLYVKYFYWFPYRFYRFAEVKDGLVVPYIHHEINFYPFYKWATDEGHQWCSFSWKFHPAYTSNYRQFKRRVMLKGQK